jgi:RNA polymerase sigma factor (TIGR02999 family)
LIEKAFSNVGEEGKGSPHGSRAARSGDPFPGRERVGVARESDRRWLKDERRAEEVQDLRPGGWYTQHRPRGCGTNRLERFNEVVPRDAADLSVLPMSEITQLLNAVAEGDPSAASQLLPLVYNELRQLAAQKLARETPGQTLQPTALVHEAYLRLIGEGEEPRWDSRGHFFAACAEAMRRILVENARGKQAVKRGGSRARADLDMNQVAVPEVREDLLALDEALDQLAATDPEAARLVQLRYFAGLTLAEAAQVLGVSPRTVDRLWAYARAWLLKALEGGG